MKEWIFKNSDDEKVFLRLDKEYLHIVPKRRSDEEIAIPIDEIEKVTFDLPMRATNLVIHRGKARIRLTGSAKMEEQDVLELLPGLDVRKEPEKMTLKDWLVLALVIVGVLGLIALFAALPKSAFPWMLSVFPLLALMDASVASNWRSWLKTGVFGLYMWKRYVRGITPVDWTQIILPGLLVTAVLFALMFLASRLSPKRAGRRLLALTLITALCYVPAAVNVLNAVLPVQSRTVFQTTVTDCDSRFVSGWTISVADFERPLRTFDRYDVGETLDCEIITGGLGVDYIVLKDELEMLNERNLAK